MDNSNWICKWTILNKVHLKLATLATATFTINIEVIFFTIVCITLKKKTKKCHCEIYTNFTKCKIIAGYWIFYYLLSRFLDQ